MQFEMNLLENSYDFISETLRYYKELGYNETHDPDRDSIEEKKRWKTTYILLVQAVELLIKEKLFQINPQLIFDNIDISNNDTSKVIGYSKSIDRICNLKPSILDEEKKQFLKTCGNIRNQCIHSTVKLNSIEIKIKYCKLFELYLKLHSSFFRKKYTNKDYKYQIDNIVQNAKDMVVCRGNEYTKKDLKWFKKEIEKGQYFCYGISKKIAYERVKYGNESSVYLKFYGREMFENNYKYCGDCSATVGEFHMLGCDCELCPKCGNQLISCECFSSFYPKEEILSRQKEQKIKEVDSLNK